MKYRNFLIWLAILALMAASLACNFLTGKSDDSTVVDEVANEVEEPTPESEADDAIPSKAAEDSVPTIQPLQPEGDIELGEEYRSAEGGFAFRSLPDFTTQEFFGIVMLEGPDATEEQGPFILMMGGLNEEDKTSDQLYDDLMAEMELEEDETVEILEEKSIRVDGHPGKQVDIAGQEQGQDVRGRVVVVLVSPTQQFTLFGIAPAGRWDEIEPGLDSVINTVYFFEPEVENIPSIIEDDSTEEGGSEDTGDVTASTPEPQPGDQFFMITDQDGNLIVMEEQYTVEDDYQHSPQEIIIGLVSSDEEQTVILALPENLSDNIMLALIAYDPFAAVKAPSAAAYIGDELYTAKDEGLIIFDEITAETISGTFFFDAVSSEDPGKVITVMGTFVKLPLPK